MPKNASVSLRFFFVNAVSAEIGYEIFIFFFLSSFTAGIRISTSSFPIFPPSPECGFNPSSLMIGFLILNFSLSPLFSVIALLIMSSLVIFFETFFRGM